MNDSAASSRGHAVHKKGQLGGRGAGGGKTKASADRVQSGFTRARRLLGVTIHDVMNPQEKVAAAAAAEATAERKAEAGPALAGGVSFLASFAENELATRFCCLRASLIDYVCASSLAYRHWRNTKLLPEFLS